MDIIVKLLGTPGVSIDDHSVLFPFKKVEALFYYLVVKGEATREELVNLLWPDIDEETGRKNLRNAIYKLKKTFRGDVLISPNKSITVLNKDLNIKTDILPIENEGKVYLEYPGEFLQGFSIKEAEYFEEWITNTREYIREVYKRNLYAKVETGEDKDNIEEFIRQIMVIDPLDERAYRILMEYYMECGSYNRAIDTFNKLTDVLERELGIAPDTESSVLYERALELKNIKKSSGGKKAKAFFYGRESELKHLLRNFYEFSAGGEYKSLFIVGEAGVGKTGLKNKFIELTGRKELYIIEANCYQAEENFVLKPWNNVFIKLIEIISKEGIEIPDLWKSAIASLFPVIAGEENPFNINPLEGMDSLKYQYAEEAVIGILKKVCSRKKTILVFEDMQWMDGMSLSLLNSILLHMENNLFFIGTCRNEYNDKIDNFTSTMVKYNKVEKLEIQRFTREEVKDFINYAVPESMDNDELIERIYEETEGNAFFLVEILNSIRENGNMDIMSSKMQDILKNRFLDVSEEGKKMLQIMSIFFDEAPLDMIMDLTGRDEFEIMDMAEELERRFIIKEEEKKDGIGFAFTHQKLREFIYMQLSLGKRRILHNKTGINLEKKLKNDKSDTLIFPGLIYHFKNAGNRNLALKYTIKNADVYLDFSQELFPVLNSASQNRGKYLYINQSQVEVYLKDIEKLLLEIEDEGVEEKGELIEYRMAFYHMYGRYYIREGEYSKGIEYIQRMIRYSINAGNNAYSMKGYRQMIYCGIQINDVDLMNEYLELSIPLARKLKDTKELGILLRLKGLSSIMSGKYEEAECLLKESIKIFEIINEEDDRFILNIAAAYNYLGDIRRKLKKYEEAICYYDKAISITEDKKVLTGLTVFNTNAGQAAFEFGDYSKARKYIKKALKIFDIMDTTWKRSVAEGYMALINVMDGKNEEAMERLKRAEYYSTKMKSPEELEIISGIRKKITR